MISWFVRAARLLGIVLVLAGFLPVLLFTLGSLLPVAEASDMLGLLPSLPSDWLSTAETWLRTHRIRWSPQAGLVFALPGILVMALGAVIVRRQRPVFEAMDARRQDALRRVRQYQPAERIEPTLN